MSRSLLVALLLFPLGAASPASAAVPPDALELRDRGLALLENENPAGAAEVFKKLVKKVPDDPLGWANLAIAALRQQKGTEAVALIERALALAPGRGSTGRRGVSPPATRMATPRSGGHRRAG